MGVSPDDPRIEQIGFAKLLGEDLELYAKKYDIIIGRKSKSSVVDVVLGTSISFFSRISCCQSSCCATSECTVICYDKIIHTERRRYDEHFQAACKDRLQV